MSVIGVAVALFLGFKNDASYDRQWEARKIWGAIVNTSRSWAISVCDLINDIHREGETSTEYLSAVHKKLIYRHVAWLTALRHQLRQKRRWEHQNSPALQRYFDKVVPEYHSDLKTDLEPYLTEEEREFVLSRANAATQIISLQSQDLRELRRDNFTDAYSHIKLQDLLIGLYDEQGKCERIKNFPFPRQYATYNLVAVWIFFLLLPLGMIDTFDDINVWYAIPFSTLLGWMFFAMEQVGEYSENPFEGRYNDIPISALSRLIEIDIRQILGETDVPSPIEPIDDILY